MKKNSILPGFGVTLGFTLVYLALLVLIPLSALAVKSAELNFSEFWEIVSSPRAAAAYRLTFGASLIAAMVNTVFGLIVAWTLVRYRFWGSAFFDAAIDLPFAIPTAVSGIALATVYSQNGVIGQFLYPLGIESAYSQLGVTIALVFIGLPFVIRTLQPAIEELERESEEAAASLGATRLAAFRKVIFPALLPAILTGFSLSFARAIGEYGSIVFISANIPMRTEVVSNLIVMKLDEYDTAGATAIALVTLVASFAILLFVNAVQWRFGARQRGVA
jgi:sulfate transport system permease protein